MGNAQSATLDMGAELEVESLRQKHHELKKQLDVLNRHISLTPAEQLESARLKKEKLLLKDRIAALGGQV
ncbi:MAG: DUF465 domain-containing protein [Deltaproteobacteria bacterium]|nr:DUF465 domain-containing protein [Deltaproteobacteria bacterium]